MATTHEEIRERIAAQLQPMFEAGKLRGWMTGDAEGVTSTSRYVPPLWRLEEECARRLRGLAEAFTVLMASPFAVDGWIEYEANYTLREAKKPLCRATKKDRARLLCVEACGKAGVALASEVLLIARTRRWYRMARGESPTTASLRRAA